MRGDVSPHRFPRLRHPIRGGVLFLRVLSHDVFEELVRLFFCLALHVLCIVARRVAVFFITGMLCYNVATMDFNQFKGGGGGEGDKKGKEGGASAPSFFSNMLSILLVFLLIVSAYSYLADKKAKTETVSLSQLAIDIRAGRIGAIEIDGAELHVVYIEPN